MLQKSIGPILSLLNIDKSYQLGQQNFKALKKISLNIYTNEYVAIIGPSGSGKSTLMNILGCLDEATNGQYLLNKLDITNNSEQQLADIRNQEIGFVFQNFNLMPRLNVLENVMQPLIYRTMKNVERKKRSLEVLDKVGLIEKVHSRPNQLSGGQRQRVAIARALVTQPSILLADEPTGNLDSKTTKDIMGLFEQLHDMGQTLILVTHDKEIADRCNRVIKIVDGEIVADIKKEVKLYD